MIKNKRSLGILCLSLIAPFIYYRLLNYFYYSPERISFLRTITGLNIHHLHYGIVLLIISFLLFIFYKINNLSLVLTGIGLGLTLDSFIPSLLLKTRREDELLVYNQSLTATVILFAIVILLLVLFYFIDKKKNN